MLNFTHELPIGPSLMTRRRDRIKSEGMEKLLEETIRLGLVAGVISSASFSKVNVDTAVQEKAITYPTDAKPYHRLREKLVGAVLSGCGYNMRKLLARLLFLFCRVWLFICDRASKSGVSGAVILSPV
jgi:hypothetical protein